MVKKIMFGIQKGGVGKTTSAVITAEMLARAGYKVLVCDLDSQGNATAMLTQEGIYTFAGRTLMEGIQEKNVGKYMIKLDRDNELYLLPSEDKMATFSRYIYQSNHPNVLKVLQSAMAQIEDQFDFIILDCPPNMGDIVINSIVYADYVIIPAEYGYFGSDGLDRFIEFINVSKEEKSTNAEILGVLMTLKDVRSSHERSIGESIRDVYGDLVFNSEIRKRAKIKEYALDGVRMDTKADSEALNDYLNFVNEVIERVEK